MLVVFSSIILHMDTHSNAESDFKNQQWVFQGHISLVLSEFSELMDGARQLGPTVWSLT